MKVAIVHLSDLHISSANDFAVTHVKELAHSCRFQTNLCELIIITITGDIIDKGNVECYSIAEEMLLELAAELKRENQNAKITYIIVPGNHDVQYKFPNAELRSTLIHGIKDKDNVPESILSYCLEPQKAFWKFYSDLVGENIEPMISRRDIVDLDSNHKIVFLSYNTSTFLELKEEDGFCVIPENHFLTAPEASANSQISISLFHHNPCWITSQTEHNNRAQFRTHIFSSSHILLCGHEHNRVSGFQTELASEDQMLYLEAESLQLGEHRSFQLLLFDTEQWDKIDIQIISLEKNEFVPSDLICRQIPHKTHKFAFSKQWADYLLSTGAPLSHPEKKDLTLRDIYVFPDMQPLTDLSGDKVFVYQDAENILNEKLSGHVYLIQGDSQSGRTSLMKMYATRLFEKGVYPLIIKGQDIQDVRVNDLLKRTYKEQYVKSSESSYDAYKMLDRVKRVIIIDDVDKSPLNPIGKHSLYEILLKEFDVVYATSKDVLDVKSLLAQTSSNSIYCQYHIEPLGYEKRNQLIEKWMRLGQNSYLIQEEYVCRQVKMIFNQITSVLGKELMPSYPIFILSLLQAQQLMTSGNIIQQAPYATLYDTLLKGALNKAGFQQGDYDGVIRFLSFVAYHMHTCQLDTFAQYKTQSISVGFYEEYEEYKLHYNLREGKEIILNRLQNGLVQHVDSDVYRFTYKYIYFYLVAHYIAEFLDTREGAKEVNSLRETLHKEESANILVFLAYLDKRKILLDELQLATWMPFEDVEEATLRPEDTLFKKLKELIFGIKSNILLDVDSHKERIEQLKKADEESRKFENAKQSDGGIVPTEEDFENDSVLRDINNTFKINAIIGQVVKNQRDTVDRNILVSLIEDTYKANFRLVNYLANVFTKEMPEIVESFRREFPKAALMKYSELETRIGRLLQELLLKMTYSVFSHLAVSVGTEGIDEYYEEVACDIDSPAAEIISFTIKSYYAPMKISDLECLMRKYKDNVVVENFLRARVRAYVYNNQLPRERKQQLGAACGMKLIDNAAIIIAKKNRK